MNRLDYTYRPETRKSTEQISESRQESRLEGKTSDKLSSPYLILRHDNPTFQNATQPVHCPGQPFDFSAAQRSPAATSTACEQCAIYLTPNPQASSNGDSGPGEPRSDSSRPKTLRRLRWRRRAWAGLGLDCFVGETKVGLGRLGLRSLRGGLDIQERRL
ncbi:hypothetical protein BDW69DRAFT_172904 [Aspergillus filifer]